MKTSFHLLFLAVALWIATVAPLRAQLVNDGATNTLSNITNTFTGDVTVGTNGSFTLLVLSDNALLTNSANGVIGRNATAKSNEVHLASASARWLMGGHLFVGNDGSFNQLVVSNGATVRDNNGFLGPNAFSSNNVAVVTGPGSVWSNGNVFYLGFNGAGNQLIVSNGGVLRANVSNAGVNNSSSNNVAVVTGSGSLWSNAFELQFGFNGAGNQLVISNGGVLRSSLGYLGSLAPASNNVVLVTGSGSLWTNTTDLYVGHSGAGNQLVVSDGGAVRNGHGYVGANTSGSNNLALVTGSGSVWSNALDLDVGAFSGNNRLIVSNGGTVFAAGKGMIGPTANGNANSAVVTDPGTRWLLASNLYVGSNGALNRLVLTNGAVAANSLGFIGAGASSSNNLALVTDSGSVWSNANDLYVGNSGAGNWLVVSNGGAVFGNDGVIGKNASSSNNLALVTGAGSLWTNRDEMYVGESGSGNLLVVSNGGTVFVQSTRFLGHASGATSNNVAIITGNGSRWIGPGDLEVGGPAAFCRLLVNDGGRVENNSGIIGSSSNNLAVVTGAGSVWSNATDLRIGSGGGGNQLVVSNGGVVLTAGAGFVGLNNNANFNEAAVTDPGSRWLLVSNLYVGSNGALSRLVVSNGALVVNSNAFLGFTASSRSNTALVSGAGTVWSNRQTLVVGQTGAVNRVVVSDGARLESRFGTLGASTAATNNEVVVMDPGSFWRVEQSFTVGNLGSGNRLVITNGGRVGGSGTISPNNISSNNEVVVTGPGSSWTNGSDLVVGGSGNRLLIRDGGEVVERPFNVILGTSSSATNNRIEVDGGALRVLNDFSALNVRRGAAVLNAGLIDVGQLLVTNALGKFEFNGGTLVTRGAVISNGMPFVVGGPGGTPAVWDVRAGTSDHVVRNFSLVVGRDTAFNRLLVTNGASLTGSDDFIGLNSGGSSNTAIVAGAGSRWAMGDFAVGWGGSFNSLVISNGGQVAATGFSEIGVDPGSENNQAVVTGSNSLWTIRDSLRVGHGGAANRALITDGGTVVVSNDVAVGTLPVTSSNNLLHVANGTLFVTNGAATGTLDIRSGTNRLDAGLIDVDRLVITNARGIFEFNGGTLRTAGTTIGTGRVLTVGDGTSAATLELRGGTHVVLGGLVIANHASLTGNGTIPGAVTVQAGGTLAPGASIGALAFNIAPVLQGATVMELSKNPDPSGLTNDQIQVVPTLTYGGSLTVTHLGPDTLAAGDHFKLFAASSYLGSFSSVTLPTLAPGLSWKNNLRLDGSLQVVATPARDFGVDVSHFQGESGVSQASWNQMFAEGKRFVFIKATEGLTGPHDDAMSNNVARATAAGLLAGVYHFAHPENRPTTNGAILEASNMVVYAGSAIDPGRLRPVIDIEGNATTLSTAALTDWVIAFSDEIIARRGPGAAPIIYCSQNSANFEFDSRLANYDLWLRTVNSGSDPAVDDPPAQGVLTDSTGVFNDWSFWQYSATGSSGGISPLDLNVCHSEYKPLTSFIIPGAPPTAIQLTGMTVSMSGAFQLNFANTPGAVFTVLATTNVGLPLINWTTLGAVTEISPGQFQFTDPQATNHPQRFYLVRSP